MHSSAPAITLSGLSNFTHFCRFSLRVVASRIRGGDGPIASDVLLVVVCGYVGGVRAFGCGSGGLLPQFPAPSFSVFQAESVFRCFVVVP
jgi:hypothetical protein